jgi:hypothetical protein
MMIMKAFVVSALLCTSHLALAAEKTTVYQGAIDLSMGKPATYKPGNSSSPYQGRYFYQLSLVAPEQMSLMRAVGGAGREGGDPDMGDAGTAYCFTRQIFGTVEMTTQVNNEDNGIRLGLSRVPVRVEVISRRPYDGKCEARKILNSDSVKIEAKEIYNARMVFDVQMGVRLETHALVISGNARIENGNLVGLEFQPREAQVQWFAYDPSLPTQREIMESTVTALDSISRN